MGTLDGRTVVMGVTGGIAAYKACEVVSGLTKLGAKVFVIMTHNACQFVAPLTFQTLSKNPVVTDTFATPDKWEVEHISLAKRAELFLIAPATANIMAKIAHGLANDMLSTTVMATAAPILIAPAMNTGMWNNPATQANVRTLKERGIHFVGPDGGRLACGDSGMGRMSEPSDIMEACIGILNARRDLEGLSVLVTAGPTREAIDPVRFLTNKSSGKMGYAIAKAAEERGARVTLVSGPTALEKPANVTLRSVETTEDLYDVMMAEAPAHDIIVQAAAPADFKPESVSARKMKKTNDADTLTLQLTPTQDVAAAVGKIKKPNQTVVCFAAETDDVLEHAMEKLRRKNADLLVANDVSRAGAGFDVDTNIVSMLEAEGLHEYPMMPKSEVAHAILDRILILRKKNE